MAELKEYEVEINGIVHTMMLDEKSAERAKAKQARTKQAKPANKQAEPADK